MSFKPSRIPDMLYINRQIPIADVAHALGLRLDGARKIHCWHPERHKNGDRTASVGIRRVNNTLNREANQVFSFVQNCEQVNMS